MRNFESVSRNKTCVTLGVLCRCRKIWAHDHQDVELIYLLHSASVEYAVPDPQITMVARAKSVKLLPSLPVCLVRDGAMKHTITACCLVRWVVCTRDQALEPIPEVRLIIGLSSWHGKTRSTLAS